MGGFLGHAASGILFMTLSTWWTIQRTFNDVCRNYPGRKNNKYIKLKVFRRWPIEGIFVVILALSGLIGEQVYKTWRWRLFNDDGVFIYSNIWQHCTMWASFVIYGTSKIAVGTYFKGSERWAKVFLTFAYFIECTLFYFHLDGRTELNIRMHTLEVLIVFLCMLFSAGEIWLPRDEILPWLRTWATFVQGSWLLQIGSTLFHPLRSDDYSWDEEDHLNVKFFSMIFAWHCILGIIVMTVQVIVIKSIMHCVFGKLHSSYTGINNDDEEHYLVIETKNGGDQECQIFRDDISRSEEE